MRFSLTANAGILADFGTASVLVDALHEKKTRFSGVSEEMRRKVFDGGGNTAAVLVTHTHADHYEEELVRRFLEQWPSAILLGPVHIPGIAGERQYFTQGEEGSAEAGGIAVRWLQIPHEGEEYRDVDNFGYRVSCGRESFVLLGDAAVRHAGPALERLAGPDGTDAALLNFPMLALGSGRRAVREIRARAVLGFHLPFEEDDKENYRKSAVRSIPKAEEACGVPVRLLLNEGDSVTIPPAG